MGSKPDRYDLFCSLLREARSEVGITQTELAHALGKPQSYVSKYESGERRLDLVELDDVCRALGVPLSCIIQRYEEAGQ